ncbi:uncharacterized protein LOC663458 [Tribolium castaneum]|uniref:Uncharacterized protein n=1 Tax=Tribolium castaneum TaxID=7070 RepID=D6WRJ8_TRICA|nr:PREDICTED: uncharacterized protein LOC663458 [Tribolium castaneum]XP_008195210.1 PREDICTED: uncharacterized protein LOC663458 [Tribolium castaneum]EFA06439.1 hypothetical protein TcasGA2_TC009321 [Tribolium castaneum]|eukprot:XP_008195209.1 PREDICTED: uncharacterized protein LOC663458 [Tribolium castaneum]
MITEWQKIFLLFICSFRYTQSVDYYDLENLGANINREVQESLKPLNNLGATITQRVNKEIEHVRQLPSRLDTLGETISQQVYEGLRPVREMQSRMRIKFGTEGGTTIATFQDNRQFIIRNGVMYTCGGQISQETGACSGSLKKATLNNEKDFCYANVNTIINNYYCIGNGNVNTGYVNGKIYCSSNDGSKTLLISEQDYRKQCGNVANSVTYKYFTSRKLGDHDSGVHCTGNEPKIVCTMTENRQNVGTNVVQVNGGSYISSTN